MQEQTEGVAIGPAEVLKTVAGFYDFADPKYIYVKAGQDERMEQEVILHESFHRTYCSCTVYGGVFQTVNHFLRQCGEKLERPLYDELLGLRNKLIERMYFVQEGGAITRALNIQPYLHEATTPHQASQLYDEYFKRLIPSYRSMGRRYTDLLHRLFRFGEQPTSLLLFNYANDALALFLMNPNAVKGGQEISLSPDDFVLLSDLGAPDARFNTLEALLLDPQVPKSCNDALVRFLAQEFGCQDSSARAETHLWAAVDNDPQHFEHRIQNAIHRALDSILPEFAISLDAYEAYEAAMNWRANLNALFRTLAPDYKPAKIAFAINAEEKRSALGFVRHFE